MSNTQTLLAFPKTHPADRFAGFWPNWQAHDRATFTDYDTAYQWAATRDGYLEGPPAHLVKLIFADGDWHVVVDFTMCMAAEEENLAQFSRFVGTVLVELTQGTVGCASFHKYYHGEIVRRIDYVDGDLDVFGDPLPEEQDVDVSKLYDAQLDKLWQNFGLSGLLFNATISDVTALEFTDTEVLQKPLTVGNPATGQKKWWQLW